MNTVKNAETLSTITLRHIRYHQNSSRKEFHAIAESELLDIYRVPKWKNIKHNINNKWKI